MAGKPIGQNLKDETVYVGSLHPGQMFYNVGADKFLIVPKQDSFDWASERRLVVCVKQENYLFDFDNIIGIDPYEKVRPTS